MEGDTIYQRGEWGVQPELIWRHAGRGPSKRTTAYNVVHLPSDRIAIKWIARRDAEYVARWLAKDVPHINIHADAMVPREAADRLRNIVEAVREARCVGGHANKAREWLDARRTQADRDADDAPPAILCHCGSAACGGFCGLDDEGRL